MSNFWTKLNKPIVALAPMADVTDVSFRYLVSQLSKMNTELGGPSVMWTEFVSADGLASPGKFQLMRDLQYQECERPVVAQIFGSKPENMEKAARLCQELGFDGVDINMGCPDDNVCKQGAGSALIKTPELAKEIINATKKGAGNIPVSVKTRLGWNTDETETWIKSILETNPACLTIHARTKKEMSKSIPNWQSVKRAVEIKNKISPETIILANGSIRTKADIKYVTDFTGCDGVMMGKAIFGNPWLFLKQENNPTIKERLLALIWQTELYLNFLSEAGPNTDIKYYIFGSEKILIPEKINAKSMAILKKHFKAYCHGFSGAKELRMDLMDADSLDSIKNIINTWLANNPNLANETPKEEYIV